MAADVEHTKKTLPCGGVSTHHMAHVYVCVHVFVHVCVISEIKHSFQNLSYLIYHAYLIYTSNRKNLCHVGLIFYFYVRM